MIHHLPNLHFHEKYERAFNYRHLSQRLCIECSVWLEIMWPSCINIIMWNLSSPGCYVASHKVLPPNLRLFSKSLPVFRKKKKHGGIETQIHKFILSHFTVHYTCNLTMWCSLSNVAFNTIAAKWNTWRWCLLNCSVSVKMKKCSISANICFALGKDNAIYVCSEGHSVS